MIIYIMAIGGGICLCLGNLALWYRFILSAAGWTTLGIVLIIIAYLKTRKKYREKMKN